MAGKFLVEGGVVMCPRLGEVDVERCFACGHCRGIEVDGTRLSRVVCDHERSVGQIANLGRVLLGPLASLVEERLALGKEPDNGGIHHGARESAAQQTPFRHALIGARQP
jgi:hypothetical protein